MRGPRGPFFVSRRAAKLHCFLMKKPKVDDPLFKHAPEPIRKLRDQAKREQRQQARKEWKEKNERRY